MPAPLHSSFFTGRMPFLPPNQPRHSTEGKLWLAPITNKRNPLLEVKATSQIKFICQLLENYASF